MGHGQRKKVVLAKTTPVLKYHPTLFGFDLFSVKSKKHPVLEMSLYPLVPM